MKAIESSAHRPTRWLAAGAIGLGLGAGILTGTGVASADGSTITNIPSPPGPIPIPYPNIAAQTVQTSKTPWVQLSPAVKAALQNLQSTLTNSGVNGLPGSTPGNSTGAFDIILRSNPGNLKDTLKALEKFAQNANIGPVSTTQRDNFQNVKDAIKKLLDIRAQSVDAVNTLGR